MGENRRQGMRDMFGNEAKKIYEFIKEKKVDWGG